METRRTAREIFKGCVTFEEGARPLLTQTNWLMPGVKESWLAEGATEGEIEQLFCLSDQTGEDITIGKDLLPACQTEIIYEDEEVLIQRNDLGGVEKLNKRYATRPFPIEFPVRKSKDWDKYKERLLSAQEQLGIDWVDRARQASQQNHLLGISLLGFFGFPRMLLGDEKLCLVYYDCPQMIKDMCETYCWLALRIADMIEQARIELDRVSFWEDMAGKQGSLIGPDLFRQFMTPYYQQVVAQFQKLGAYHFEVDSDGNVQGLIPLFLEAGVTCLFPFESQAGMDIVKIRKQHSRLVIHGGIDKAVLTKDRDAIDRELDYKLPPLIRAGGYMCAIDHRVVLGTTFESMQYFMERVVKMIGK